MLETSKLFDVGNIQQAKEIYMDVCELLEARSLKKEELPLNFIPPVSAMINGLTRGELVVVGARPSNGKSIFCLQVGLSLALAGAKVHFCSLEMNKITCGERLISNLAKVNTIDLQTGKALALYKSNPVNAITLGYNHLVDANFTFSDAIGFTWEEIETLCEGMKNIDVLIIDYIQMISAQDRLKKETIDEYIKKLRVMAQKKKICVVLASQINRAGATAAMPQMHELKQTGCLEEVADKVFLLHYNYFYTKDINELNKYEIILEKNRQGRTFKHECKICPEFSLIKTGGII